MVHEFSMKLGFSTKLFGKLPIALCPCKDGVWVKVARADIRSCWLVPYESPLAVDGKVVEDFDSYTTKFYLHEEVVASIQSERWAPKEVINFKFTTGEAKDPILGEMVIHHYKVVGGKDVYYGHTTRCFKYVPTRMDEITGAVSIDAPSGEGVDTHPVDSKEFGRLLGLNILDSGVIVSVSEAKEGEEPTVLCYSGGNDLLTIAPGVKGFDKSFYLRSDMCKLMGAMLKLMVMGVETQLGDYESEDGDGAAEDLEAVMTSTSKVLSYALHREGTGRQRSLSLFLDGFIFTCVVEPKRSIDAIGTLGALKDVPVQDAVHTRGDGFANGGSRGGQVLGLSKESDGSYSLSVGEDKFTVWSYDGDGDKLAETIWDKGYLVDRDLIRCVAKASKNAGGMDPDSLVMYVGDVADMGVIKGVLCIQGGGEGGYTFYVPLTQA